MWYKSESTIIPDSIDSTSSELYVFVRKNIADVQKKDDVFFEYEECKIPKDVYDIFKSQLETESRINDIEEAVAEIIGGGLYE